MDDCVIRRLTGPERIRLRPAVIFGDLGTRGALFAVKLLLDIFCFDADLGYCTEISVLLHADGEVEVRCKDRGLCLDDTLVNDVPAWRRTLCSLDVGPREPDEFYPLNLGFVHNEMYGDWDHLDRVRPCASDHRMDLCCVQYASEYFHVEAVTTYERRVVDFVKGHPVFGPIVDVTGEPDGTVLRFRLDTEVFGEYELSVEAVENLLAGHCPCEYKVIGDVELSWK